MNRKQESLVRSQKSGHEFISAAFFMPEGFLTVISQRVFINSLYLYFERKFNKLLIAKTFKWSELATLLKLLGYKEIQGEGSRVKFDNGDPDALINLHRPHPGNEMKLYAIKQVKEKPKSGGLI